MGSEEARLAALVLGREPRPASWSASSLSSAHRALISAVGAGG